MIRSQRNFRKSAVAFRRNRKWFAVIPWLNASPHGPSTPLRTPAAFTHAVRLRFPERRVYQQAGSIVRSQRKFRKSAVAFRSNRKWFQVIRWFSAFPRCASTHRNVAAFTHAVSLPLSPTPDLPDAGSVIRNSQRSLRPEPEPHDGFSLAHSSTICLQTPAAGSTLPACHFRSITLPPLSPVHRQFPGRSRIAPRSRLGSTLPIRCPTAQPDFRPLRPPPLPFGKRLAPYGPYRSIRIIVLDELLHRKAHPDNRLEFPSLPGTGQRKMN